MSMCMLIVLLTVTSIVAQILPHYDRQEKDTLVYRITEKLRVRRAELCPDRTMCRSQWGYCGTGPNYCGKGCTAGPCTNNIINDTTFACVFNTIDNMTRTNQFNALKQSGLEPINQDEAAVFLAHVYHETDGLKSMREYCAPGCGPNYAGSWCSVTGKTNKLYYGRGWLQLSWPCNYYASGQNLSADLLSNPDLVEQRLDLALKTAIWFYKTNKVDIPAQQGDFAATTRIINGLVECYNGTRATNQQRRVTTYKRIQSCFELGVPTKNPTC